MTRFFLFTLGLIAVVETAILMDLSGIATFSLGLLFIVGCAWAAVMSPMREFNGALGIPGRDEN